MAHVFYCLLNTNCHEADQSWGSGELLEVGGLQSSMRVLQACFVLAAVHLSSCLRLCEAAAETMSKLQSETLREGINGERAFSGYHMAMHRWQPA